MVAEVIEQGAHGLMIQEPDEQKSIMLMDRMDLDQALAELRGEVVERFVYTVPGGWDKKNNRKMPDKKQLSYAGVREAARLYKNVHFGATAQQMPDGSWILTAFAHNHADNLQCSLPIPYPAFNPAAVQESIAYRAALSKCVRMPLAAVLPITYIETLISKWAEAQGHPGPASREQATAPARRVETTRSPVLEAAPVADVPPLDKDMEALRLELAELLDRFPDARKKLQDAMAAANATTLTDTGVRKAVASLRERAATEAQQNPQQLAVDMTKDERMAQTIPFARSLCERLRAAGTRPTPGEISTLRTYLAEIQRCDPLSDDEPVANIRDIDMLPLMELRLAVPPAPTPTPRPDDDPENLPF